MVFSRRVKRSRYLLVKCLVVISALFALAAQAKELPATYPVPEEVKAFFLLLNEWDYFRKDIKDSDLDELLNTFADSLDPERVMISREELSALSKKYPALTIKRLLQDGSITPAHEVFGLYKKSVEDRCTWAIHQIPQLDFRADSLIASPTSPEKRPLTQRDLDTFWRQTLRHEIALARLSGVADGESRMIVAAQFKSRARNVASYLQADVAALFLRSVAKLYDPWGDYFDPRATASLGKAETGPSRGLGALLNENPVGAVFAEVLKGGPAANTGHIAAGDLLVAVRHNEKERIDLAGLQLSQITDLTRGPADTRIDVLILHPNTLQQEWLTLTRAAVPGQWLQTFLVSPKDRPSATFGVISIPALYGTDLDEKNQSVSSHLKKSLERLNREGARGIVVDLRSNGGGLLSEAIQVAGQFLGNVSIARVGRYDGEIKEDAAKHIENVYTKPVVVLVDEATASGAEIIAGALKDYGRAVVVGPEHTFGNGYVQTVVDLKSFNRRLLRNETPIGFAKITVQAFYLPRGESTEVEGITPDIQLSTSARNRPAQDRKRPKRPTPVRLPNRVAPLTPQWSKTLSVLRGASEERQNKLDEWSYFKRYITAQRENPNEQESFESLQTRLSRQAEALTLLKTEGVALREQSEKFTELKLFDLPQHSSEPGSSGSEPAGFDAKSGQPVDVPLLEAVRVLEDLVDRPPQRK